MVLVGHIKTLTRVASFSWITCLSLIVHGEACVVRGGYHLNSDHWPIDGSLRLERMELWGTINHDEFSQRRWVPKTDEAKQIFKRGVAKDLCWMDGEARGEALVSVEEIIYSHAVGIDSDNCAIRQWSCLRKQETFCRSQDHTETRSCT